MRTGGRAPVDLGRYQVAVDGAWIAMNEATIPRGLGVIDIVV